MNWLCRMIGHKWFVKRDLYIDGLKVEEVLLFSMCLRCGAPQPKGMISMSKERKGATNGKA